MDDYMVKLTTQAEKHLQAITQLTAIIYAKRDQLRQLSQIDME